MNKLFLAAGLSAAMATGAMAGGYTSSIVEVEPVAVVEAPQFSWTGAYAGVSAARTAVDLDFNDAGLNGSDSTATYGVLGGYRHQFQNDVVVGAEASYAKTDNLFESGGVENFGAEAQVGYAFDRVLPYVAAGYNKVDGEDATSIGAGVDYAFTDNFVAGVKYTRTDVGDYINPVDATEFGADVETVSVRALYKF